MIRKAVDWVCEKICQAIDRLLRTKRDPEG